jgi:hypothetical protein
MTTSEYAWVPNSDFVAAPMINTAPFGWFAIVPVLAIGLAGTALWYVGYGPDSGRRTISLRSALAIFLFVALICALIRRLTEPIAGAVLRRDFEPPTLLAMIILLPSATSAALASIGRSFRRNWRWGFSMGAFAGATFFGYLYIFHFRRASGWGALSLGLIMTYGSVAVSAVAAAIVALGVRFFLRSDKPAQAAHPDRRATRARVCFWVLAGTLVIGLPTWGIVREPAVRAERQMQVEYANLLEVRARWAPLGWEVNGARSFRAWGPAAGRPGTQLDVGIIRRLREEPSGVSYFEFREVVLSDEVLAELADLQTVEGIILVQVTASRDGITHLAKLPRLRFLQVTGGNVSITGLEFLRQSRPDLSISGADTQPLFP